MNERDIDQACKRFKAIWKSGKRPRIEEFLAEMPAGRQRALLRALLAIEISMRRSLGEAPTAEEYRERFGSMIDQLDGATVDHQIKSPPTTVVPSEKTTAPYVADRESSDETRQLGRFQIRSLLGQGAFGKVYRAFDPVLEREVAIKLPKFSAEDRDQLERFLREARTVAKLRHPNIVTVFDIGQEGDQTFIASELIEGQTLADTVRQKRPSMRRAVGWVKELALALAYAHGQGIVHRDIKPGNVMIDVHGRALVMDFGLAKQGSAADPAVAGKIKNMPSYGGQTSEGVIVGTPAYMSPEQARGESKKIGPRSDQYSLGLVLFQLLTGQLPFEGNVYEVLAQTADRSIPVPAPRSLNPKIPPDLNAICLKAMSKSAGARYPGADELALDLQRWLNDEPVLARPRSLGERTIAALRRHKAWLGAAAATLLMAAVTILVVLKRPTPAVRSPGDAKDASLTPSSPPVAPESTALERQVIVSQCQQYREQGVRLCEQGHAERGVLFLIRALKLAGGLSGKQWVVSRDPKPGEFAWDEQTEKELGSWANRLLPLRGFVPADAENDGLALCPDGLGIFAIKNQEIRAFAPGSRGLLGGPFSFADLYEEAGFSRDGRRLWVKGVSAPVRVWDLSDGKQIAVIPADVGYVRAIALSPDGRELIIGGHDGQVIIWDLAAGNKSSGQRFYDTAVSRLIVSPTEYVIVTGGQDGVIRRFDRARGMHLDPVLKIPGSVQDLTLSRDGKRLAGVCFNESSVRTEVRIFDMETGRPMSTIPWHKGKISAVVLAPNGLVATAGLDDHRVRIWKDEQTEPLFDLTHDGYVTRLLFTGDGQHLVAGTGVSALNQANVTQSTLQPMNALRLWDVNTGTPVGHALQQNAPVADLASSPDQKTLLSADGAVVRFWDLRALVGAGPTLSQPDAVSALAFSPEGKRLLSGGFDKTLRLWDLASRKLLASALVPQSNIIRYLMFSPDGKQLLAGSDNNSVTLYDAETLKPITPALKHDNSTYIAGSAFRPDGQGVLTITVGGEVWMWDGKETATGKKRLGEFLALSPDGKVAATKGKEAVELSDPATGAAIASIPLKYLFISGAAFSPDGKWLVICSDNQLVTWDMVNHRKIREPVLIILTTYLQHIRSLRIDPDNETVWVRGDHAARKYSLRSGKALGLPILHDPEMMSLASSMDGRTMASGGRDGKILLWNPLPNIPYGYESIERWLEMTTGMALNKEGVVGLLKPREWEERRKELEKLEKDSTTELARSLE